MNTRIYINRIAMVAIFGAICASPLKAQLGSGTLDTNNVKFTIYADGSGFEGSQSMSPQNEVPKGNGMSTIYASNLWMGAIDNNLQLRMSAQTYKQTGTDFWSGPINTTTGSAANPSTWNTVWKVNKSTIDYHIANYSTPGYVVPAEIANWPGNGPSGFSPVMAPFMDMNGNSLYEPALGDYPFILGDQALYFIFNDKYTAHGETGGLPLGAEIHGMAYSFNNPSDAVLNNTVFVRYSIVNRNSFMDWNNMYLGVWTDFDIGDYSDDFVGTDSVLSMYYGYNGDAVDGPGPGSYGSNPPVQAVVFLSHPMTHSIYSNNDFTVTGNPVTADDYYGYMQSMWKDSVHATYGGNGYASSASSTDYLYTGDPISGTGWTESTAGNSPADRRMLGAAGPFTLTPGTSMNFDIAYVYSRSTAPYPASNDAVKLAATHVNAYYANNIAPVGVKETNAVKTLGIYPNPAGDRATLHFDNNDQDAYTLRVFDATGKLVKEQQNITGAQVTVDCSDMPAGIYFAMVQGAQKMFSGRLIVK